MSGAIWGADGLVPEGEHGGGRGLHHGGGGGGEAERRGGQPLPYDGAVSLAGRGELADRGLIQGALLHDGAAGRHRSANQSMDQ